MPWVIYDSADEPTQIFVGILLILSMVFLGGINLYFWIKEKIKK
jgi:hypothetical protein